MTRIRIYRVGQRDPVWDNRIAVDTRPDIEAAIVVASSAFWTGETVRLVLLTHWEYHIVVDEQVVGRAWVTFDSMSRHIDWRS